LNFRSKGGGPDLQAGSSFVCYFFAIWSALSRVCRICQAFLSCVPPRRCDHLLISSVYVAFRIHIFLGLIYIGPIGFQRTRMGTSIPTFCCLFGKFFFFTFHYYTPSKAEF
jgi:hypothetical protein